MPAVLSASDAARCVTCHGVRSHAEPVALVGECSVTLVHAFLALAPISQPTTTPRMCCAKPASAARARRGISVGCRASSPDDDDLASRQFARAEQPRIGHRPFPICERPGAPSGNTFHRLTGRSGSKPLGTQRGGPAGIAGTDLP